MGRSNLSPAVCLRACAFVAVLLTILAVGCETQRDRWNERWDESQPEHAAESATSTDAWPHEALAPPWDCNRNGFVDSHEIRPSDFGFRTTFNEIERGPFPVESTPIAALVADLDGSGGPDVVTLNRLHPDTALAASSVSIVWNHWVLGAVSDSVTVPVPESGAPKCLVAGDLDGDDDIDLAVLHEGNDDIIVLLNSSEGAFTDTFLIPLDGTFDPDPICLATLDIDGDGDLDLAVTTWMGDIGRGILLVENEGGGSFAAPRYYEYRVGERETEWIGNALDVLAVGDLDNDDKLEIIAANSATGAARLAVFEPRNAGDLAWDVNLWSNRSILVDDSGVVAAAIAIGDIDGDDDLDVVTANADSGTVAVLRNRESLGWHHAFEAAHFYDVGREPRSVALADLDGDGDLDLVTADSRDDTVSVLLGAGDGTFAERSVLNTNDQPIAAITVPMFARRFPDILAVNAGTSDVIFLVNTSMEAISPDCNNNERPDSCDIGDGSSSDTNENEIPDECE